MPPCPPGQVRSAIVASLIVPAAMLATVRSLATSRWRYGECVCIDGAQFYRNVDAAFGGARRRLVANGGEVDAEYDRRPLFALQGLRGERCIAGIGAAEIGSHLVVHYLGNALRLRGRKR